MAVTQRIVGSGECAERVRRIDWSKTELGPLSDWPDDLVAIVNGVLHCPIGIVLVMNAGGLLIYNDEYARFAGRKHPAILGQNYAEAWPEIADYNRDMCARVNSGEIISYEARKLQLKRGNKLEDVYLDLNYSPTFNGSGDITAMQVSVVDVTNKVESKRTAEAALHDAKVQRSAAEDASLVTRTLTDNASTALFILDDKLRCTFLNPAASRITGFTQREVVAGGRTLHELIHHSHPDGSVYEVANCPIIAAVRDLQVTAGDDTFVKKDGSFFPVNFVASPIIQDGELTSVIIEVRDMTETEQLKELNQAKDDFIAMASHQLRTPATSVKQYIGIIMQELAGPVNEDQLQYLQTAYNANERQLNIINDLLKTALVDIKGYRLRLQTGDLSAVLRSAAQAHADVFDTKRQRLQIKIPNQTVTATFDRVELAICVDNLLENASKYSGAGSDIVLRLAKRKTYIDIAVSDSGVGIDPLDHEAIFEKFTRINNTLSDTVSGSGLGLYWVKRIVDLHGGKVIIDSTVGVGTTFTIRLPI